MKKALKRCGHPNWVLNRRNKKDNLTEKVERRGKVILPYVKGISENLALIFKKHDIETIHKPSTTLKNTICNKMKDKVDNLHKTGAVYYNRCKNHKKKDYVGETERVLRERLYEHRIIDHKTATRSASIDHPTDTRIEEPTSAGLRRSQRTTKRRTTKLYTKVQTNH